MQYSEYYGLCGRHSSEMAAENPSRIFQNNQDCSGTGSNDSSNSDHFYCVCRNNSNTQEPSWIF